MTNLLKLFTLILMFFSVSFFANSANDGNGIEITLKERLGKKSIVSESEYSSASEFTKRMINQIDGAIAALEVLGENKDNSDLEALVSITKDKDNKFKNAIVIAKPELEMDSEKLSGSCTVCGVRSAYQCLRQIEADDSLGEEFSVKVKRLENGCVRISW